jgi:protein Mpv17
VEHQATAHNVEASTTPARDDPSTNSAADDSLLTISVACNLAVLGSVAVAAATVSGVLEPVAGLQSYGTALHDAYGGLLASHPVALKAAISGVVFALGDLTAQAYEGAGVSSIAWARTARSGAVGVIQGPLGHAVFSSDGCLIDRLVEQQGLEQWQQPLAKIAIDQTVLSLAWNSMYFGMLGAMRLDPPGQVLGQLWSSGFSLMKAGWRLWPLAHVITYGLVPAEHRMLWVLAVELGWVSLLLFWSRQRALNDDGEADSWAAPATAAVAAAAADSPAPQVTMERSASQEMRVLLMDSMDELSDESYDGSM